VSAGVSVLDVASGTGVLVPWYLKRGAASITAVDISPEMVNIGKKKYPSCEVNFICGDVETLSFDQKFDRVIVFNSFPHFSEPERLVCRLAELLKPGGSLTVAHSMSRAQLDKHHAGSASMVSIELLPAVQLETIFGNYLSVTTSIDNDEMYQVVGIKKG
jgi:demethylmenaquinone methyltransferase/2-methoxy-6-polyprenyl-1,4-benzoquinol methylase